MAGFHIYYNYILETISPFLTGETEKRNENKKYLKNFLFLSCSKQWRSGRPRSPRGCGGGATLQGAPKGRLLGVTKKREPLWGVRRLSPYGHRMKGRLAGGARRASSGSIKNIPLKGDHGPKMTTMRCVGGKPRAPLDGV